MQSKNLVIYNQRRQLSAALFTKLGPLWVTNGLHLWEVTMKYEEVKKLLAERKELEFKLRKQIDEKLSMLMDAGYRKDGAYKMLANKIVDYRTLKLWHTGETMKPSTYDKLMSLIEEENNNG